VGSLISLLPSIEIFDVFRTSTSPTLSTSLPPPFKPQQQQNKSKNQKHSGPKAEAAELRARFLSREARFNVPLPHISDPDSARELGRLLGGVRVLALDERSSALGGATDALAASLAAARGGRGASRLRELDLAFRPHSWAADLFSDSGLVALARAAAAVGAGEEEDGDEDEDEDEEESEKEEEFGLVRLRLHGAGAVSDAGLSAAAACCPFLRDFELTGYTELVSDRGISALVAGGGRAGRGGRGGRRSSRRRRQQLPFVSETSSLSPSSSSSSLAEAANSSDSESESSSSSPPSFGSAPPPAPSPIDCPLQRLCLGARLPKVSDAGIAAVVARAGGLKVLRLPGRCTDASLFAVAASACRDTLEELDASACASVTAEGARAVVGACPKLRSLRLPAGVEV